MKKLLASAIIGSVVLTSACSAAFAGTAEDTAAQTQSEQATAVSAIGNGKGTADVESWDWGKSYWSDGTAYIYNMTYYYGEETLSDDSWAEVDLLINQSKDGVMFGIYTGSDYLTNTGSDDISVPISLQLNDTTSYSFTGTMEAGYNGIQLNSSDSADYQKIMNQYQEGYAAYLYMDFSGYGFTCVFELPLDTDYSKIISAMDGLWYVPTSDNTIYTGSDVNPDLVTFVSSFAEKINEALSYMADLGIAVNVENFLSVKDSVSGLADMYDQYEMILQTATRSADIEYLNEFEAELEKALLTTGASTAGDALSEQLDESGHPVIAGIVDIITDERTGIVDSLIDEFLN